MCGTLDSFITPLDVAVCGLPNPREDHAVVMSRAARDYVYKMSILTKSLEVRLGPDTGDLNIRIGLHRYDNKSL
jgi:hypothetical protein